MLERNEIVSLVGNLVLLCRDGQNGFRNAAEHAEDNDLKDFFSRQSAQWALFADELEGKLQQDTEKSGLSRTGNIAGTMQRAWTDLTEELGGGDLAILDSMERSEDGAKRTYEEALTKPLPSNIESIVRNQAKSVVRSHDKLIALRESLKTRPAGHDLSP